LSISVIKKYKTVLIYLAIAVLASVVDKVYAIFGHGVSSAYMTWMFLYPLFGGALFFLLLSLLAPQAEHIPGYRLFRNIYNSGIAMITTGSLVKGIFEIAGTDSPYVSWYYVLGILFLAAGMITLLIGILRRSRVSR
jgi:hypothetical protein